ncbi:MAG: hypothetical protein R3336_01845 [Phycisphaeraceae bacterium]|nr:hypothetical protein [Phycisphaeraceae bacterium]
MAKSKKTKIEESEDVDGKTLNKGDTVTTLGDMMSARISDMATDSGTDFVCLRPLHRPYGKGVWHSADRVKLLKKKKR